MLALASFLAVIILTFKKRKSDNNNHNSDCGISLSPKHDTPSFPETPVTSNGVSSHNSNRWRIPPLLLNMRQRSFMLPVFDTGTKKRHSTTSSSSSKPFPSTVILTSTPTDDADVAAGQFNEQRPPLTPSGSTSTLSSLETAPASVCTINTKSGHPGDLEFFEDLITEPVLVLGVDISHLPRATQFAVCASGLFFFSLLYGYLQELLSVELCSRQLGLFLAQLQFSGYTVLAYILRNFVYNKTQAHNKKTGGVSGVKHVPIMLYLGLALLRAVDLAMTNLAMQYINYPAKTLMKSSRVVFTMIFGVLIQRKVYKTVDYAIVLAMVAGLALFMHADANSSAVFHHMGVIMLTISLVCDGAISNMSETIMSQFGVGQDEFIFRLYSISLIAITTAAAVKGDMYAGLVWMTQPGTYQQHLDGVPLDERSWSAASKIAVMVLFSSMGFFGSSCSAAITKNFGALTMSITSTARKATTLFLSFFLFNNVCTAEHVAGIAIFISALTTKSMRRRGKKKDSPKNKRKYKKKRSMRPADNVEMQEGLTLRQRANSNDGSAGDSRSNLVHVV